MFRSFVDVIVVEVYCADGFISALVCNKACVLFLEVFSIRMFGVVIGAGEDAIIRNARDSVVANP